MGYSGSRMNDHNHLHGLNAAQKQAVETTEGPVLVLAGAGSGKTRVITHRIIHLIEKGTSPHNILAVTFTNKAAKEMRERVQNLIQEHFGASRAGIDSLPTVTTFHALGVRILRENHEVLGLRRHFVIYDRSDSNKAIKKALEQASYDPKQFEPRKMLSIISKAKGDALSRLDFMDGARSYPEQVAGEIWEHYDKTLREEHALDFDDLLLKTVNLLKSHPDVLEMYRERFKYIHIDEYQDTNKVQYEIARLLTGDVHNICVVGDVDQSIYSWRGANISNILQFEKHFPETTTIFLEENYRSTQTIIAASNDIIEKNFNRPPKKVFTNNHEGELIELYVGMNGNDEAEHIALRAKELIKSGASPSHIAVLYRTNFQSRVLEEAFLNFSVPYQLLGTKFFERREVKDALSYLRLAMNPDSTSDLARVINTPVRGIGKVTLLKLMEGRRDELKGSTREKVENFYNLMDDIAQAAREQPLSETFKFILKRTGIEEMLKKDGEEGLERIENLRELVTLAARYDELESEDAIEAVLEEAALQSDQDEIKAKEEQDAVRLMTVHSAKGLEFPYVFITGLEEGLFPHERLSADKIDEEEERRLFYVALTRAEKKVFLSFAHIRTIFGSQRINAPSQFIGDIREELLEHANPGGDGTGYETTVYLD
ncbi:ATP-dependent DNA helicase PcrA [Candidatus Kaiserbacteria bacterium CG10_big_fil_rev_8_21_14_0_10_47_16]|uniref:DNA 3'-5' helicase n=1 Tax=Candidatus Kaiserbacteria bacterium CG10_big_fil_rev_8_21_14_0_10_47_16 TaxID=1974608 RepID=A0A2H0UDL2_9BACT|nr:MAG: ATP-dependent DNA helicase PcrA [Candidatus Kaiserbacteria bacterium CG10_big_fil_rev_8_21_14_0_10_47_16]